MTRRLKLSMATVSGLVANKYADDDWKTYQKVWEKLQIHPSYQQGFFEQVVYPYRQKPQNKILLKRNTEAGIKTMTQSLLRGYGKRVWGANSHWLVGGPRNGVVPKIPHTESESHEPVGSTKQEESETDDKESLDELAYQSDEDNQHSALAHPSMMEDLSIAGVQIGDSLENGNKDVEEENQGLYFEIPEHRKRIELILNDLWRQMRSILFEDRSLHPEYGSIQDIGKDSVLDIMAHRGRTNKTRRKRGRRKSRPVVQGTSYKDEFDNSQMDTDESDEAGNSPDRPRHPGFEVPYSHEDQGLTSLKALLAGITGASWEQATRYDYLPFASAPGMPNLRALLHAHRVDAVDEPVNLTGSTYGTIEEAQSHPNDQYRGNPIFNPFKWLIEKSNPRVRYEAELYRRNINPKSGEPYTWSEIARLVCGKEADSLYQYRIWGRQQNIWKSFPCDSSGIITDVASCSMATAEMLAEGRISEGSRLIGFHFDQYGNIAFLPKNVMKVGIDMNTEDLQWFRLMFEQAGYKFTDTNNIIAPPGNSSTTEHPASLSAESTKPMIPQGPSTYVSKQRQSTTGMKQDIEKSQEFKTNVTLDAHEVAMGETTTFSIEGDTTMLEENGTDQTVEGTTGKTATTDHPNQLTSLPKTGPLRPNPSPLTGSRYYFNREETAELIRRVTLMIMVLHEESEPKTFQELWDAVIDRQKFVERGQYLFKDHHAQPPAVVPDWMTNPATDITSPCNEPWAHYAPGRAMPTSFPLGKPASLPKAIQIGLSQSPPLPGHSDIRYFETSWIGDDRVGFMMRFYEDLCEHCTLPIAKIAGFSLSYGWSEKMKWVSAEARSEWPFNTAALPANWDDWAEFMDDLRGAAKAGVRLWRMKVLVVGK